MRAIVVLLVSGKVKEVRAERKTRHDLERWIIRMMDNPAFVFGRSNNGSFWAVDVNNFRTAHAAGLL